MKLIRGGSWHFDGSARPTASLIDLPRRYYDIGFRCVCGAFLAWRSIRGGTWYSNPEFARASTQGTRAVTRGRGHGRIGFRCARRTTQ
jgi:formylglycine-generating enzyme required for sulfatase activity